jgi:multiple antibiotic resistance protein
MLHVLKTIVLFVSALFPIVNPLGGSPIFLALTSEYSRESRMLLSQRIAINSFILLVVSFVIGTHILAFFGISLPIVQVGGGLIVISTGWAMLKEGDSHHSDVHRTVDPVDIFQNAFYPLTLPLTVGPGSISIAITLGANEPLHFGLNILGILAALIGSALIAISIFICYGFADRLAVLLGPTGMTVIMRLSSFLLVCIGVQILWHGVSALLGSLPQFAH